VFFWKRGCCCESTNHKSCGCPSGTGSGVCSGTYGHDKPEFPETITINYTRWSLCATSAAGNASQVYDYDHDCCNGGTPCTSPDAGFCGTCAEGSSHSGGDDRAVAGAEMSESESSQTITLTLQDGTNGRDGDPAATACKAYYRGVIRHEYEGPGPDELQSCDCEEGYGATHGGFWDCWHVVLELDRYSTGTRKTRITATISMSAKWYLQWGMSGDVTTPPDESSSGTAYSGTYAAEFVGVGNELGDDINGNQDCGYCYFPYQAFNALELTSGGHSDPGAPPMADGIDTDMTKFGSWDTEYCCDYFTDICYCTVSIDYPTWDTYWWQEATLLAYFGGTSLGWTSPVHEGRCESIVWSAIPSPPTLGAVCDTSGDTIISPAGDCLPDCVPPPCDYSNVDCLSYQNPYTSCIGGGRQVWYAWTNQHYLNVSLSI
jgi:hypothetical protein